MVGGLFGKCDAINVNFTFVDATVASTARSHDHVVGGVVGFSSGVVNLSLVNSQLIVKVKAVTGYVGGLVGAAQQLNVSNCFASLNVSSLNQLSV